MCITQTKFWNNFNDFIWMNIVQVACVLSYFWQTNSLLFYFNCDYYEYLVYSVGFAKARCDLKFKIVAPDFRMINPTLVQFKILIACELIHNHHQHRILDEFFLLLLLHLIKSDCFRAKWIFAVHICWFICCAVVQ